MHQQTLPPESDRHCDCCGRLHRKLYLDHGYWLGKTCAEHYWQYRLTKGDKNSLLWRGWEKQYDKVAAMVNGSANQPWQQAALLVAEGR